MELCAAWQIITKTCLYNFDPLKPHFYIVKLGFTGVCIIFLISAQNHRLWVLVRTASPIYVLSRNMKKYQIFLSKKFMFLEVKFSIYLNRRVFVMCMLIVPQVYRYTGKKEHNGSVQTAYGLATNKIWRVL